MARRLVWTGLLLLLAQLASGATSAEDQKVLDQAATTKTKYCSKMESENVKEVTYERGKKILEFGLGTDNPLYKILMSSKDEDDLTNRLQNEIGAGFVISTGWPIVLSILVGIAFYGFIMWTCCCKVCRCCVQYRKPSLLKKGIFAAALILTLLSWSVCAGFAFAGSNKISDGSITAGCSAANLIEDMMAGSADNASTTAAAAANTSSTSFVGIIPMVDTFNQLVGQLDDSSSPLLSGLTTLLADTSKIDEAVAFAEATIALLKQAMENANNIDPKDPDDGKSLYHKCELCAAMSSPLDTVRTQLTTGVANALKDTRGEVETQLDPSDPNGKIKELSTNVKNAIEPLNKVKDEIRDIVGWFVKPDGFQEYADHTQGAGSTLSMIVLYAFLPSALILLCGCTGLGLWQFQEKHNPVPETDGDGRPRNPYLLRGPGVVCFSWFNAFIFAINLLFIGGLMIVVSVPVSGSCLVLTEMNYENGKNLLTSIGQIKDGKVEENMQVVLTVMDRCLSLGQEEIHKQNSTSLNLMDMVTLKNGSSRQTVRDLVVAKAIQPVKDQFAQLDEKLDQSPTKLSVLPELLQLRRIFGENPISATYRVDLEKIKDDPDYGAMYNTPAMILWACSLSCANHTVNTADLNIDLQGYDEIPGIDWAWDTFSNLKVSVAGVGDLAMGVADPAGTCADGTLRMQSCSNYDQVPIKPPELDSMKAGCDAGSNFMQNVKKKLQKDRVYRCMVTKTQGQVCDPATAYKDPTTGLMVNTCLELEKGSWKNSFTTNEASCTLDEFNAFVKKFDVLLETAFLMLDTAVVDTLDDVKVKMRSVVDVNVLDPMYGVINQCNCNFMLDAWKGLLNGVCFSGTGGYIDLSYSYVILATSILCLGIVYYIFWRIMRDNYESYLKEDSQSNGI